MLHSRPSPRAINGATESRHLLRLCALAIAALATLVTWPAGAAEPPLSLAEALKLAVSRSQQLASQRSMVDAAREMAIPAGELPDPKLRAGVENVPTQGQDAWSLTRDFMTMSKIGLMQEFPREEKRRLKATRVERDAERGTAVIEATTLAIERETATAWVTRHFASAVERSIGAQMAEAELNVTTLEAAYRAGKAPQSELIAAQSMLIELSNRATDAAAQAKRAQIALARYVGDAALRPQGDAPDFARLPDAARLADIDAQPELRLARAQTAIAETESAIARAAKQPDWSAEVSYAYRGAPYSNMVSVMFTIDLPWSQGSRQDREHAAKLREEDAARAMQEDTQRMRAAEVQSMQAEWESARAQARRIETALVPLAVQRREAALAAYRGGTGTLAAVLDARRALLDAELSLISQQQAAAKAWAWLNFVVPATEGT
jgi:outer membrane protein TolC